MIFDFANAAHQIGGLSAMAGVCLVQYAWHVAARTRLRRERDDLIATLESVADELSVTQEQSHGVRFENEVLCELLAEPTPVVASHRLLQHFVPLNSSGVAAFFSKQEGWSLRDSVGLTLEQAQGLTIDSRLVAALSQTPSLFLDRQQLELTQLGRGLRGALGESTPSVYLFRATPEGEPLDGIVMTSQLPDCGGGPASRLRTTERLLAVAGRQFRRTATAVAQEQELRVTREILELRSLVDSEFRTPQEMVEQFLARLTEVAEFEHAGVYLQRRKDKHLTRLARFVLPTYRAQAHGWGDAERRLAQRAMHDTALQSRTDQDFAELGIEAPFPRSVTVPMRFSGNVVGVLCLSGTRVAPLTEADHELLIWSAEYLLDTILKSLDRASIEDRATKDALTGLANRHTFDQALENHVERAVRLNRECTLILIDLDHFKQTNDRYGHPAGDETLRVVSRLIMDDLKQQVRGTDHPLAARYGGEELAVILPGVGLAGGRRIAESIRRRVELVTINAGGVAFEVTLSAGVAAAPTQGATAAELLSAADGALYRAKAGGRNRVEQAEMEPVG